MSQEIKTETKPEALVQTRPSSALAAMAGRYSVEPAKLLETLKNTVFKGANNEQLMALVIVANEFGLNPFTKQIYAFPDKGGGIIPVIGIDGWLKMMNDHPQFDGLECEMVEDGATGKPHACTITIHRKDRKHPVKSTEYLGECARNTDPWNRQPRRMLRHRATIQAIRVAFGFSAMDPDEAEPLYAAPMIEVSPVPDFGSPKQLTTPKKTKATRTEVEASVEQPVKQPELAPTDEAAAST